MGAPRRHQNRGKRKADPEPRDKREFPGVHTGLFDSVKHEIVTGEYVSYAGVDCVGPVFWSRHYKCYGIFSGLWYGDRDPMNVDNYGKFVGIPSDNGAAMHLRTLPMSVEA